jgi:hypothetical protein
LYIFLSRFPIDVTFLLPGPNKAPAAEVRLRFFNIKPAQYPYYVRLHLSVIESSLFLFIKELIFAAQKIKW